MKKLILLLGVLVSLTAANVVFGQSGVITYEVKVNLHRRLPPERADMKAMIPEFRTTKEQLFFNGNESLYKPLIEDEDEEVGGGGMRMVIRQPNNEIYLDQATGKIISKQEFMGKNYLIEERLTLADIAIIPFIRQTMRTREGEFDMTPYPRVLAWANGMLETLWFKDIMLKKG